MHDTFDLFDDAVDLQCLAEQLPPTVLFGTSSWTYPGWNGFVYRRAPWGKPTAAELLREYARFPLVRTVGIDSAYYGPPSPPMLEEYARVLPSGFRCVSKVWDRVTTQRFGPRHGDKAGLRNPDFLNADLFLAEVLEPSRCHLGAHMGPFVFEFSTIAPSSGVGPDEFSAALEAFLQRLPRGLEYAVEVRNEAFLTPAYFAMLRRHSVAHTFTSWTHMPSIAAQLALPGSVTAPFLVARALARPGRTYDESVNFFKPFNRIREPSPDVREDLLRLIALGLTGQRAYILVGNRLEGSSPRTIVAVAEQWAQARGNAPLPP